MKYMVMHKTNSALEAGALPTGELMAAMGAFCEEGFKKGVLISGEGLRPSSLGVRLNYSGGKRTVTKGPFAGKNELIAGFCMMRVKSLDEAIEWGSRFAEIVGDVEIDIRPVCEPWDLGMGSKPAGDQTFRYMAVHKADKSSEAGAPPSPEMMEQMGGLIQDMSSAGVLIATEGLTPSSRAIRLNFAGGKRTITDGPFAESKELIAGYAILEVKSREEVIEWATRFANVLLEHERKDGALEIDIRPLFGAADSAGRAA